MNTYIILAGFKHEGDAVVGVTGTYADAVKVKDRTTQADKGKTYVTIQQWVNGKKVYEEEHEPEDF